MAIWWLCQDQRHTWVVDDLKHTIRSDWIQSLSKLHRDEVVVAAGGAGRGTRAAEVQVLPVGAAIARSHHAIGVPADEAERWLAQPVHILVENSEHDGHFIRLVLTRVGLSQLNLRLGHEGAAALKRQWKGAFGDGRFFRVLHGGGNNVHHQLRVYYLSEPDLPAPLLVIVDSDRSAPDEPVGPTAAQVAEEADKILISPPFRRYVHTWKKRSLENYLPHKAIRLVRAKETAPGSLVDPDFDQLKKEYGPSVVKEVFVHADAELHSKALRERAGDRGRELDQLAKRLIDFL